VLCDWIVKRGAWLFFSTAGSVFNLPSLPTLALFQVELMSCSLALRGVYEPLSLAYSLIERMMNRPFFFHLFIGEL